MKVKSLSPVWLQARILEQVAISFSRGSSRPRDRTQVSHIAGRNTVSQKTSYSDTELQIQVLTSKISREERNPGWRRGMRLGKRGDLIDVSCYLQIPRCYGTFPWASREGRTGTRPSQKSDLNIFLKKVQKVGDICIPMADSCWSLTEHNKIL